MKRRRRETKNTLFKSFTENNLVNTDIREARRDKRLKTVDLSGDIQNDKKKLEFLVDKDSDDYCGYTCGICHQAQNITSEDVLDTMICCEGTCMKVFHLKCLKLTTIPEGTWKCEDCTNNRHRCYKCGDYGIDTIEKNEMPHEYVKKCIISKCGLYFHWDCLKSIVKPSKRFLFKCPCHECCVCHETKNISKYLYKCEYCMKTYHANCIPPNSKYNDICLLCPQHSEVHQLPRLYDEKDLDKTLNVIGIDLELPIPNTVTGTLKTFCLPFSIYHDVKFNLPKYTHIFSNEWIRPKYRVQMDCYKCQCVGHCGKNCINRCTNVLCKGSLNNCNVGKDCGNRHFKPVKLYESLTLHKGWGVKAGEDIKSGDFIIEYVGEVIDDEEEERRLKEYYKNNEKSFYIMQSDTDTYIDARNKGNISRFINHSCEPNCIFQKWLSSDGYHMYLFALKDINKGEELTYDYHFFTKEKTICHCGSTKCRGYLGSNLRSEYLKDNNIVIEEKVKGNGKRGRKPTKKHHRHSNKKVVESPKKINIKLDADSGSSSLDSPTSSSLSSEEVIGVDKVKEVDCGGNEGNEEKITENEVENSQKEVAITNEK